MLVERIIEFDLRELGPRDHTFTVISKTGYFHGKTKFS